MIYHQIIQAMFGPLLTNPFLLLALAGLLVIIIAAGIVANEFTWGTIKVLLIKPFYRWKILLAKYVTIVLFLLLTLLILFVTSLSIGAILLGTGGDASNIHLAYTNGTVVEQSIFIYLIKVIFAKLIKCLPISHNGIYDLRYI